MANPDGVTLVQEGADAFPQGKTILLNMNAVGWGDDFRIWKANIRGVDLNRNYNIVWNDPKPGEPMSYSPYYAYYSGPAPESEPETKVITNWARANRPKLLLDYHSSGEYLYWYWHQTGAALERDRIIARAIANYTGFVAEPVDASKVPNTILTRWSSMTFDIPSITVEVGTGSSYNLTMDKLPGIFAKTKYLPLAAILQLPDYQPYVPVQSISLPQGITTVAGTVEVLTPSFYPESASITEVHWESSDPGVASVDATGQVTINAVGTATIKATSFDGGYQASCVITALPPLPRISGANRFQTAVEISRSGWEAAESIVLARGDDFADALAGVPLAHKLGVPLLLSQTNLLSEDTKNEIRRLGAGKVYLLGGEVALSETVENTLIQDLGVTVERISGANRYQTAVEIARRLEHGSTAVIAYGHNFPDAVSVASYAAANGYPILLTGSNELHPVTSGYLQEQAVENTIVVGGEIVISNAVMDVLPAPFRLSGRTRYDTAVVINNYFNPASMKYYVTTGINFSDALAGAALAAKEGTGLLLIDNNVKDTLDEFMLSKLPVQLTLLGGSIAVPTSVEVHLRQLLMNAR